MTLPRSAFTRPGKYSIQSTWDHVQITSEVSITVLPRQCALLLQHRTCPSFVNHPLKIVKSHNKFSQCSSSHQEEEGQQLFSFHYYIFPVPLLVLYYANVIDKQNTNCHLPSFFALMNPTLLVSNDARRRWPSHLSFPITPGSYSRSTFRS